MIPKHAVSSIKMFSFIAALNLTLIPVHLMCMFFAAGNRGRGVMKNGTENMCGYKKSKKLQK